METVEMADHNVGQLADTDRFVSQTYLCRGAGVHWQPERDLTRLCCCSLQALGSEHKRRAAGRQRRRGARGVSAVCAAAQAARSGRWCERLLRLADCHVCRSVSSVVPA